MSYGTFVARTSKRASAERVRRELILAASRKASPFGLTVVNTARFRRRALSVPHSQIEELH
jgi:hypothetical protein